MLETKRLVLRQWAASDIPAFVELNSDTDVMEYFPSVLQEQRTIEFVETLQGLISARGWGFWATELKDTHEFIGMVGLNSVPFTLPPSIIKELTGNQNVEVGWRLAKRFWGNGYATEAAKASVDYAFQKLGEKAVIAFTPVENLRSRRVMAKLNMSNLNTTFRHPGVPADSALAEHVLYKIDRSDYIKSRDWH